MTQQDMQSQINGLRQELTGVKALSFDKIMVLEDANNRLTQERNQLGELLRVIQKSLGMEQDGIDAGSLLSLLDDLKKLAVEPEFPEPKEALEGEIEDAA